METESNSSTEYPEEQTEIVNDNEEDSSNLTYYGMVLKGLLKQQIYNEVDTELEVYTREAEGDDVDNQKNLQIHPNTTKTSTIPQMDYYSSPVSKDVKNIR